MTDAESPSGDHEQVAGDEPMTPSREIDRALAYLVWLAEAGVGISVTLFIGATQVSGNVIGGKRYFETLASGIRNAEYPEEATDLPDVIADSFLGFQSIYENLPSFETFDPTFIHLTNTRYTIGDQLAGHDGLVWRGKLAAVDGFVLGQLSQ